MTLSSILLPLATCTLGCSARMRACAFLRTAVFLLAFRLNSATTTRFASAPVALRRAQVAQTAGSWRCRAAARFCCAFAIRAPRHYERQRWRCAAARAAIISQRACSSHLGLSSGSLYNARRAAWLDGRRENAIGELFAGIVCRDILLLSSSAAALFCGTGLDTMMVGWYHISDATQSPRSERLWAFRLHACGDGVV